MRRNPFAAIAAAVRSLIGAKPAKRVVQLPSPGQPADASRLRAHSKHGRTSLAWRRRNHARRRKLLAGKFLRLISRADHPLIAMARKAPPSIREDKARARRWARNKLKKSRRCA